MLSALLLCPLTALAAEWQYDGQGSGGNGLPAGETGTPAGVSPTPARDLRNAPVNAMTMPVVRETFGDPERILDGVGEPPIARWQYPEYVVYFENELVIIAVAGRL